jgi:hypothetical protein
LYKELSFSGKSIRSRVYLLDDPINWNSFFNYPPIAHLANHANLMTDFVQEFGIPWQMKSVIDSKIINNSGATNVTDSDAVQMGFNSASDFANATGLTV